MHNIKFSVVIPTFNRAVLLIKVIDSVLAQTYPPHEIVIIDDGSTDGTAAALEQYVESNSKARSLVRYFHQENAGQSVGFNSGIAKATGEWIAFDASDDTWRPGKLEWQARAIESNNSNCGACFTDAQFVNNSRFTKRAFQLRGQIERNLKSPDDVIGVLKNATELLVKHASGVEVQTLAVRTDLARQIGGFDPKLHLAEDTDFLFRLSLVSSFCFVNLPLVDIDRNENRTDGLTELVLKQRQYALEQFGSVYEKWLQIGPVVPQGIRRSVLRMLQDVQNELGSIHLVKGNIDEALQVLFDAHQLGFNPKVTLKYALVKASPQLARKLLVRHRAESGPAEAPSTAARGTTVQ